MIQDAFVSAKEIMLPLWVSFINVYSVEIASEVTETTLIHIHIIFYYYHNLSVLDVTDNDLYL